METEEDLHQRPQAPEPRVESSICSCTNKREDVSKDSMSVISKGESKGKREIHTISCLHNKHVLCYKSSSNLIEKSPVPVIEKSPVLVKPLVKRTKVDKGKRVGTTILSYLDSIKSILNNPDNTPEKAQSLIENSWISILIEQLNDEKKLINKYSHRFSNILIEVNITLNSLQENNLIRRKFPFIYKDLNNIDFIFISYSLCLAYSNRIGYTALTELVGKNIIYRLFRKSECSTLTEFKIKIKYSNLLLYKLGDFFISLFTQLPHDLFERYVSSSSFYSKEPATLIINSDYLEDIKNNIIVHPYTLPMVCKPNVWSEESFGGFLDNVNKMEDIITGSHHHNHLVENKKALFKTINNLNSIKFSVNNLLLDYLQKEGKFLLDFIKEDNDIHRTMTLKIAESFSNIPFYLNVQAD